MKDYFTEERIEIIVAIMLGLTAVLTAWATWVGSLHGGNQATNYTTSNNLSAEGNSLYNEAAQLQMQDMLLWNEISDLEIDVNYADSIGDTDAMELAAYKLYYKCLDNLTDRMAEKIGFDFDAAEASEPIDYVQSWLEKEESGVSPFDDDFNAVYFEEATEVIAEADEYLVQGQADNKNGDRFNLVVVIYAVVLFLLGIVGIFKKIPNRIILVGVAALGFLVATIYMITIPLPFG